MWILAALHVRYHTFRIKSFNQSYTTFHYTETGWSYTCKFSFTHKFSKSDHSALQFDIRANKIRKCFRLAIKHLRLHPKNQTSPKVSICPQDPPGRTHPHPENLKYTPGAQNKIPWTMIKKHMHRNIWKKLIFLMSSTCCCSIICRSSRGDRSYCSLFTF